MKKLLVFMLLVALALLALFFFLRGRPQRFARDGAATALFALVPADAQAVLYFDAAALRQSALWGELAVRLPSPKQDREYEEFVKATGFDYTRDLDRGLCIQRGANPRMLVAAEGRFDRDRVLRYWRQRGRAEKQAGQDVYILTSLPGTPPMAAAFANSAGGAPRILLGEGGDLSDALAMNAFPPASGNGRQAWRDRLARAAGARIFVVARVDALRKVLPLAGVRVDGAGDILKKLDWLILTASFEPDSLRIGLEGEATGIAAALQISALLEGLRMMGRGSLHDPDTAKQTHPLERALLTAILDSGRISLDGRHVQVRFQLPRDLLFRLTDSQNTPARQR